MPYLKHGKGSSVHVSPAVFIFSKSSLVASTGLSPLSAFSFVFLTPNRLVYFSASRYFIHLSRIGNVGCSPGISPLLSWHSRQRRSWGFKNAMIGRVCPYPCEYSAIRCKQGSVLRISTRGTILSFTASQAAHEPKQVPGDWSPHALTEMPSSLKGDEVWGTVWQKAATDDVGSVYMNSKSYIDRKPPMAGLNLGNYYFWVYPSCFPTWPQCEIGCASRKEGRFTQEMAIINELLSRNWESQWL